jgi:hypothetical protein
MKMMELKRWLVHKRMALQLQEEYRKYRGYSGSKSALVAA